MGGSYYYNYFTVEEVSITLELPGEKFSLVNYSSREKVVQTAMKKNDSIDGK